MACNCKKKIEIEEKYGEPQEEGLLEVISRYIGRFIMVLIVACLSIFIFPLVLCVIFCQVLMGKEMQVSIPDFITRRLKR